MWSSYDFYSWTPAISAAPWLVALIAVLLNAVVIWLATMLVPMLPLVDHWHLTALPTPRAASPEQLEAALRASAGDRAMRVSHHASPQEALDAAAAAAVPTGRIVVFGSFYTVGGVLKDGPPRLQARPAPPSGH